MIKPFDREVIFSKRGMKAFYKIAGRRGLAICKMRQRMEINRKVKGTFENHIHLTVSGYLEGRRS